MEAEVLSLTNSTDALTLYIPLDQNFTSNFTICVWFLTCSLLYPTHSIMVPLFSLSSPQTQLILFLMPFALELRIDHSEHVVMSQFTVNGDWYQLCLQSTETENQTTDIYLNGNFVSTAEFGVSQPAQPPNLYLGAYTYVDRKVMRMDYHGLLSNLDMWYDSAMNITSYYMWDNATQPDVPWNPGNIRVRREQNLKRPEKLIPDYAEHTLRKSEVDSSGCKPSKILKDIKPVVEKTVHQPTEAKGAKAYGSICMGMLIFIGVIIVLSDVRYFGRVLPIARRNIKTGMNRLRNMLQKTDMLAGMNQLITLTVSLARDNPTNQQAGNRQRKESKMPYRSMSTSSMPTSPTEGTSTGRKMKEVKHKKSLDNYLEAGTSGLRTDDYCASAPCLQKYSTKK